MKRDSNVLLITAIAALSCTGASWLASRCVERRLPEPTSGVCIDDHAFSDERREVALLEPAVLGDSERSSSREAVTLVSATSDASIALRERQMRILLERLLEEQRQLRAQRLGGTGADREVLYADEPTMTISIGQRVVLDRFDGVPERATDAAEREARLRLQLERALDARKQR